MKSRAVGPSCLPILLPIMLSACSLRTGDSGESQPPWTDHDRVRAERVRHAVTELRADLETYYGGRAVLEDSWYLAAEHPARAAGTAFMANKFARAVVWGEPVVIGAIGSSVLAGYDNCRHDCYPQQLERLLGPVLDVGASGLEVRNTGQGGNCGDSFSNQIWCLPTLAGEDIDIAHYSWTYFESGQGEKAIMAHEMFYRWALMMGRSPAPQLVYTGTCRELEAIDQALLETYARYGADILCMTRGLARLGYQRGERGEQGNPLHASSREGDLPGTSRARRASLSVMYRNWHPGPLQFQTAADAMAWRYSEALLLALDWIAAEPDPRSRWPRAAGGLDRAELPAPLVCPDEWCGTVGPPACVNFEQPVFGPPGVEVRAALDRGWIFDPGEPIPQPAMPVEERTLPQCQHPNRCSGWRMPAGRPAGPLAFQLPDLDLGLVAVCCGSKQCGQKMLDAGVVLLLDGRPPPQAASVLWDDSKCLLVQERFPARSPADVARKPLLEIRLPPMEQPLPPITHVFGL